MLVSASRRTDIPAFYGQWLLNRLREGYALVRNPFNPLLVTRVSLLPEAVDGLVLWTKNPAPLLSGLGEIERLGHRLMVHCTLTAFGRDLEPMVPSRAERIRACRVLAERIGPERVVWRFDPILFTPDHSPDRLLGEFAALAGELRGSTHRCIISLLTLYRKCLRNLTGIALLDPDDRVKETFIRQLADIAGSHDMVLQACCDPFLQEQCHVERAGCIDDRLFTAPDGQPLHLPKDRGQRPGCGCAASVDIGAYNTCPHGCLYCYANTSSRAVAVNRANHDPRAPLLIGSLSGRERIVERR